MSGGAADRQTDPVPVRSGLRTARPRRKARSGFAEADAYGRHNGRPDGGGSAELCRIEFFMLLLQTVLSFPPLSAGIQRPDRRGLENRSVCARLAKTGRDTGTEKVVFSSHRGEWYLRRSREARFSEPFPAVSMPRRWRGGRMERADDKFRHSVKLLPFCYCNGSFPVVKYNSMGMDSPARV